MTFRPLFALALPTALAACGTNAPDPRGVDRDEVLLRVVATGESETRPDVARFVAGVSTIAPTSEAATRLNSDKMTRVMAAVEKLGIAQDDTRTQALTVNRIDWGPNKGRFEATNQVSVKVRKIDAAGSVIGAATAAGANILSGPDLQVEDRETASKGAYAAAYKAARARAEAYAGAAGLKVVRILSITDGSAMDGGPQPYTIAEQASDAMARTVAPANAPPVRPGLETARATVKVEFVLAE